MQTDIEQQNIEAHVTRQLDELVQNLKITSTIINCSDPKLQKEFRKQVLRRGFSIQECYYGHFVINFFLKH